MNGLPTTLVLILFISLLSAWDAFDATKHNRVPWEAESCSSAYRLSSFVWPGTKRSISGYSPPNVDYSSLRVCSFIRLMRQRLNFDVDFLCSKERGQTIEIAGSISSIAPYLQLHLLLHRAWPCIPHLVLG